MNFSATSSLHRSEPDAGGRVQSRFNQFAGASFGVALFYKGVDDKAARDKLSPLALWSVACQAIVAGRDVDGVCRALNEQVEILSRPLLQFSDGSEEVVRGRLKQLLGCSWTVWLPFILFSPAQHRQGMWDAYTALFPAATHQQDALRQFLFRLLTAEQLQLLYNDEGLDPKYMNASPGAGAIIRVGKLVGTLKDTDAPSDTKAMVVQWRTALLTVLEKLQRYERVTRGFAPEDCEFEDLLLAILAVAEWRIQPELWRVHGFVESCGKRPDECLTADQLALSGALFGLQEGYRHIGSGLVNRKLRRHLAREALALALISEGGATETISFYLSDLSEPAPLPPTLQLLRAQRRVERDWEWSPAGGREASHDTLTLKLQLAETDEVFHFKLQP